MGRLFLAASLIHRLPQQLHDVELVEGQLGAGELLAQAADERRRHIQAGLLNLLGLAAMSLQVLLERLDRARILTLGGKQHSAVFRIQVHEHADVVVAPAAAGLVDPNGRHLREIRRGAGLFHVVLQHPPDPCVVLADQPRDLLGGHAVLHQRQNEGVHQQGETRPGPGPGHLDGFDSVVRAFDSWVASVQQCLVLEEVQVPPSSLTAVVHPAALSVALRAGEPAAGREVQPQIQLLLFRGKLDLADHPRLGQTQSHPEQLLHLLTHRLASFPQNHVC